MFVDKVLYFLLGAISAAYPMVPAIDAFLISASLAVGKELYDVGHKVAGGTSRVYGSGAILIGSIFSYMVRIS
jgi:hypothetical protein